MSEGLLDALERALSVAGQSDNSLTSRLRAIGEAGTASDAIFVEELPGLDTQLRPGNVENGLPTTQVSRQVTAMLDQASQLLHRSLLPALAVQGVRITSVDDMDVSQQAWLQSTFTRQLFPLLIPLAVDPGRPFPRLRGNTLNLLIVLHGHAHDSALDGPVFALVEAPDSLNRWLPIRSAQDHGQPARWFSNARYRPGTYVWSEDVMRACIDLLFPGMAVGGSYLFRVLYAQASRVSGNSAGTGRGPAPTVARLDVEEAMPSPVRHWLIRHLDAPSHTLVRSLPPMAMGDLVAIADRLPANKPRVQRWLRGAWDALFGHI